MKQNLLNKLWLRVGMIVAIMTTALAGTAWAETVTIFSEDFNDKNADGWTLSDQGTSFQGTNSEGYSLQMGSTSKAGSATTPEFTSLVGTNAILTFKLVSSSTSETHTLTITGNGCKVNGQTSMTASAGTTVSNVTIAISEASTSSTITFSAAKKMGVK